MIALITGASSGIGRDMARILNNLNYDIIITARNEESLKELKKELNEKNNNKVDIYLADLSKEEECLKLYNEVKEKYQNIDLLINNAGFGLCGKMINTDLETEMKMIDTNIKAVHILTKLFLKDMVQRDSGRILNVASVAAFMAGPLMATYYASKNYVLRFSQAIKEELKKDKSNVKISVLCPGPVNTNFNKVANVKFALKSLSSEYVAKYAINKTLKGKFLIIPGWKIKIARFLSKISPDTISTKICYHMQSKKIQDA
jgi:short-chain dehydrogenases of various substrate specificities